MEFLIWWISLKEYIRRYVRISFVPKVFYKRKVTCLWEDMLKLSIYLPAFMVPEKNQKKPPGTRDKCISNHRLGEKEKIIGQKERNGQPHPTPWKKSRDTQSVVERKLKTVRESCNATIIKVLNTRGANYKINLNRESKIFY